MPGWAECPFAFCIKHKAKHFLFHSYSRLLRGVWDGLVMALVTWGIQSWFVFSSDPLKRFVHGVFCLNGDVVRFASTSNEKICHWDVFVGIKGGRLSFSIRHWSLVSALLSKYQPCSSKKNQKREIIHDIKVRAEGGFGTVPPKKGCMAGGPDSCQNW